MLNTLFFCWPVPSSLPPEIESVCERLRAATDQEDALRQVHALLSERFRARRSMTYVWLHRILRRDPDRVWASTGFLHCTHMNWLLKILLVRSGWVKASDIRERWTLVWWISPHQYAEVWMKNGRVLPVDVWGKTYGVPFGEYAHGFRSRFFRQSSPT